MLLSSTTISDGRKPKVNYNGMKLVISDGTFGNFVQPPAYISSTTVFLSISYHMLVECYYLRRLRNAAAPTLR